MSRAFQRRYGAGTLHVVSMCAAFGISGYAALKLLSYSGVVTVVVWFMAAAVVHDLVLFPLYVGLDRLGGRVVTRDGGRRRNYLRVPALLSGLLLLLFFPLIAGFPGHGYEAITTLTLSPYLGRWLLLTGILFACSGVLLIVRPARD